jgi:hypothetical protein
VREKEGVERDKCSTFCISPYQYFLKICANTETVRKRRGSVIEERERERERERESEIPRRYMCASMSR